jgi:hypothetical protein
MKTLRDILFALVLILVAGVLYFVGTSGRDIPKYNNGGPSAEIVDNFGPSMHSVEILQPEKTEAYEVSLEVPTEENAYGTEVLTFVRAYADDFKRDAEKAFPQIQALGSVSGPYLLDIQTRVFVAGETVSYVVYSSEYTGGANANNTVFTFVYEVRSENRLQLEDVIPTSEREIFMNSLRMALYEQVPALAIDNGFFSEAITQLTFDEVRTFYLDSEDNVHILFSKYEIAPGAAGSIDVVLP